MFAALFHHTVEPLSIKRPNVWTLKRTLCWSLKDTNRWQIGEQHPPTWTSPSMIPRSLSRSFLVKSTMSAFLSPPLEESVSSFSLPEVTTTIILSSSSCCWTLEISFFTGRTISSSWLMAWFPCGTPSTPLARVSIPSLLDLMLYLIKKRKTCQKHYSCQSHPYLSREDTGYWRTENILQEISHSLGSNLIFGPS